MTEGEGHRQTFSDVGQTATTSGLFFPGVENVHDVSDGYHTMGDLYDHRRALTVALCRALPNVSWRSRYHHPEDQPMFEGYFIVGITLPSVGQVSYHYKHKHWDLFRGVHEVGHAPKWDRHTPEDVVERLTAWR